MKNKCENMYCEGHDVKCLLTGLTLGDNIGYNGKVCAICQQIFLKELIRRIAKVLIESSLKGDNKNE